MQIDYQISMHFCTFESDVLVEATLDKLLIFTTLLTSMTAKVAEMDENWIVVFISDYAVYIQISNTEKI